MTRTTELLAAYDARPSYRTARALVAHLRGCIRAQLSLSEAQKSTVRQALARLAPKAP